MTKEQLKILNYKYLKNPNWSSFDITAVAERLEIPRVKIYKWLNHLYKTNLELNCHIYSKLFS